MPKHINYLTNVFINCPFDDDYKVLFEGIVFAIYDCGFIARCALEEDNAAEVRLNKILRIIDECKYGIHDLSRATLDPTTHLGRLNMAFELGIFIGAHYFPQGTNYNKEKRILIMDTEKYRYQQFISDINGQEIKSHNNDRKQAIENVRNFLAINSQRTTIPGGDYIFQRFEEFNSGLPATCDYLHLNRDTLTFLDFSTVVRNWITAHKQ